MTNVTCCFSLKTKRGETVTFELGHDYGAELFDEGDASAKFFWRKAGIEKLIAAGIWKREFSRGSYGSDDAELKTLPPSVGALMVTALAPPVMPPPSPATTRSIVPAAAAVKTPASSAPAPAKPAAMTPDEVAREINERNARLHRHFR